MFALKYTKLQIHESDSWQEVHKITFWHLISWVSHSGKFPSGDAGHRFSCTGVLKSRNRARIWSGSGSQKCSWSMTRTCTKTVCHFGGRVANKKLKKIGGCFGSPSRLPGVHGMKVDATIQIHPVEQWDGWSQTTSLRVVVGLKTNDRSSSSQIEEDSWVKNPMTSKTATTEKCQKTW